MARITGAENSIINRVVKNNDPAELLARIAESNRSLEAESARQAERDRVLQQRNANKAAPTASPAPTLTMPAAPSTPAQEQSFPVTVGRDATQALINAARQPALERQQQQALDQLQQIENEGAYITTAEQSTEHEARRRAAQAELDSVREDLNAIDPSAVKYLSSERGRNTVGGFGGQWASGQVNTLGTLIEGGNALQEASSAEDKAINDSLYSGWVTDDLSRTNFLDAGPTADGVLTENKEAAQKLMGIADNMAANSGESIAKAKQNLGTGGQIAVDLAGQGVQMALDAVTGLPTLSLVTRTFGGSAQEARQEGQGIGTQFTYGGAQAAKEWGLNKLLGGVGKIYGNSTVGKAVSGALSKAIKNEQVAAVLGRILNTEGAEEGLSSLLDPAIKAATYKGLTLGEAYSELELEEVLYNALIGQLLGGIVGNSGEPGHANGNAVNLETGAEAAQNGTQQAQDFAQQQIPPTTAESGTKASGELNPQVTRGVTDEVMEMLVPGISNSQAAAIISNPEARAAFESLPNAPALKGTNSQQRGIIKDYAAFLAAQAQTEADSTAQTDPAQMLVDEALGQSAQASPATDAGLEPVEAQPASPTPAAPLAQPAQGQTTVPESGAATAAQGDSIMAERSYTQNVRDSSSAEAALRQDLEDNRELYRVLSNSETLSKAEAIYNKGFPEAYQALSGAIQSAKGGAKLSPEMVPLSRMVANELTRQGRVDEAHAVVADIAAELTAAGQLGQAGAILRNAGPAAKAAAVQKMVDKLNNDLTEGQKRRNQKVSKGTEAGRISVDEALVAEYANAETDAERDAALDKITTQIAEQIPATFVERWNAWRYVAMLGNLKTQGRNIIGNAVFGATATVKRRVQALMELAAAKISGGKYQPTLSLTASKQLRNEARADFDSMADTISGAGKYTESGRVGAAIQDKRQIFRTRLLEGYRKLTQKSMEVGDRIFLRAHYADALSHYLQAHGVTSINEASPKVLDSAREFAIKEAQEATFRDRNAVSEFVSGLGKAKPRADGSVNKVAKGFEIVTQGIMPFRSTPANVLVRGEEYSPLGAINAIVDGVRAAKGDADASQVINDVAKATTGTSLFAAGLAMALSGAARGSEDDEKLAEFQNMQGAQDYSIKVGNRQISVAQFAPAALPFVMGVEMAVIAQDGDGFSLDSIMSLLGAVSDPMLEMSMLQGINDAFENINSYGSDSKALPALLLNSLTSYLTQGLVPSLLRQGEQAFEKNRQTTYSSDDGFIDKLLGGQQYTVAKALGGIPGIDYNQQDYVDAWGRTQSNGNVLERIYDAFINPTYGNTDRSTEVDAELERLYAVGQGVDGYPAVLPQRPARSTEVDGQRLSPEEYIEYSKAKGQKSLELVKEFMASEMYQSLEGQDELRAQIIADLYEYAGQEAKALIQESRGAEVQQPYKALNRDDVGEFIATRTAFNTAVDAKDYGAIDALLETARELDPKAYKTFVESTGTQVLLDAAKAGVGSEAYYAVNDIAKSANDRRGGSSVSDADRLFGIANADISNRERDAIAKVLLGETLYGYYEKARAAGYSAKEASNIYARANTNGGAMSQSEMYDYIQRNGIDRSEAERLWSLFGWKTAYGNYKP